MGGPIDNAPPGMTLLSACDDFERGDLVGRFVRIHYITKDDISDEAHEWHAGIVTRLNRGSGDDPAQDTYSVRWLESNNVDLMGPGAERSGSQGSQGGSQDAVPVFPIGWAVLITESGSSSSSSSSSGSSPSRELCPVVGVPLITHRRSAASSLM